MSTENAKQLVEFMVDEYVAAMEQQNAAGQTPPFDIPAALAAIDSFRKYAVDYLNTNRPQQFLTNMDGNYGIVLTNLKTFLVAPPIADLKGTMQPSSHVQATGHQTAADMQAAGAMPITGNSGLIPPGSVDFSAAQGSQDMSQKQPSVRFDAQHPAVGRG